MKILITTDTVGGVWTYTTDLALCLSDEKIEVVLVAMGPSLSKGKQTDIKNFKKHGITFYHQKNRLEWMDDPWEDVKLAGEWLKEIFQNEQPDLIHFNNYGQVDLDWNVPTIVVAHSCVTSWWFSVKKEPLPQKYEPYFDMVRRAFEIADVLVSPSNAQLEIYQKFYGVRNNQTVVYNGIPNIPEAYSNKLPILFSMGRTWDEGKNVELMLQAAPKITGEIFIAGADPKTMDRPKNVTFLGELTRSQIFNWLKICCGFVLPVKYEPFGIAFLEAAAHKTALIGGNISTLNEIWGDCMNYVDPDDPMELANACNQLLTSKEKVLIDGDKAYYRSKRYPLKKMEQEYQKLYESVFSKSEWK